MKSVADLREAPLPPQGPKISQFHAVFLENFGKIVGWPLEMNLLIFAM